MAGRDSHWHIKPEISIGHMISTIAIALTLVGGWVNTSERITRIESGRAQQNLIDQAQNERMETLQQEIVRSLDKVEKKVDKLIEREMNRQMRIGSSSAL